MNERALDGFSTESCLGRRRIRKGLIAALEVLFG